ncbi:tRNA pseudouridine synthase A [uncultured Amnibacterium sp.]|uniref:tRNA pseudouridine synthase A n=1 Tax=uncultured Amnibacterium sp. TaxID=1631851 RepID=UPI0035CA2864
MDGSVRVRLDLAYDGTDFAGWAVQPGQRTVQGELERALAVATGRADGPPPRLVVAGRTDAGVHATGQVAHVDLTAEQLDALTRGHDGAAAVDSAARRLTGLLSDPGDVVVHRASTAPTGFDARFGAVFRRYRYRIADRLFARDPVDRRRTMSHPRPLDDDLMRDAAVALTGLHDFAAYCKPRPGATTIRELQLLDWRREADGVLVAEVRADAFCHNMVRALVGAGIAVGVGRIPPERMAELLASPSRSNEFAVAPAHGLTLVEVGYPADADLAAQAERARARRELA